MTQRKDMTQKGRKHQKSHTQLKPRDPATIEKVSEQSSNPYFKKGTLKQQIEINDLFSRLYSDAILDETRLSKI